MLLKRGSSTYFYIQRDSRYRNIPTREKFQGVKVGWFGQRFSRLKISVSIYCRPALRSPKGQRRDGHSASQEPLSSLAGDLHIWIPAPESWRKLRETDTAQQRAGLLPIWTQFESLASTAWKARPLPGCSWQRPEHLCQVHQLHSAEDRILLQGEQPGPTLCPPLSRSLGSETAGAGHWGAEIWNSYLGPSSSWKLPARNRVSEKISGLGSSSQTF